MSKAVLILDMPDRCGHCRLAVMQRCYPICAVTGLECAEGGKPEWCPLRSFPQYECEYNYDDTDYFARGWNACLKELEGEHE